MRPVKTTTLKQAKLLAQQAAAGIKGGEIFALVGPLGSGKTTFVKAAGRQLKVKDKMASPSFSLLHRFVARLPKTPAKNRGKKIFLYHLDLYRTKNFSESKALGLLEFWGKPNTVTFIEWANKIKKHLPKKTQIIKFKN
jgi:tRNA threonylcarbamoyladenosine biosynthesis protein TsaE